ncbi:MAG: YigZ family protein [Desulfobacteraceae bacterium]|nr:YigZ family protein [Desulfobacteraceae bacterium]
MFTCHLSHAGSIAAAKEFISKISKENKTATHNCWAYIVGDAGQIFHSSDAGEPSGTAGKPMLNVLAAHNMTRVAAVVTREYGGVKLGIRGLIQAYSDVVTEALSGAKKVRLIRVVQVKVRIPYGINEQFLHRISGFDLKITHTDYGEQVIHEIMVQKDLVSTFYHMLSQYENQGLKVLWQTGKM